MSADSANQPAVKQSIAGPNDLVRGLKIILIFALFWPAITDLSGTLIKQPSFSFGRSDILVLLSFGYGIHLIPAILAGMLIAWAQSRRRRFNWVYIALAALLTAIIPPVMFLDKDNTTGETSLGLIINVVSFALVWIIVRMLWPVYDDKGMPSAS